MLNRRDLLATAGACVAATLLPRSAAAARFDPQPGAWRGFTVTTRLDIAAAGEPVQAWIPLPSVEAEDWIVQDGDTWDGNAATAEVVTDPRYGARLLHASFAPGEAAPSIEVVSRFRTRDRAVFDAPQQVAALSDAERTLWLAPTELMPVDGIVKETADRITAGVTGDREQARAIYEWVVENTERTAATRGCGLGDVASMLETGFLGGKCADLNALYVALARASGLPARDLYGIRVAPSAFGYKSLGANSEIDHQVAALPRRGLPRRDRAGPRSIPPTCARWCSRSHRARTRSTARWWSPRASGCSAPGRATGWPGTPRTTCCCRARSIEVAFLMYPQAEVAGVLLDCLDPDGFRYAITAAEVVA